MLVLSRKLDERIRIGDEIVITVKQIAGNRVSIGIEAPDHVRILRGELEPLVRQWTAPAPRVEPAISLRVEPATSQRAEPTTGEPASVAARELPAEVLCYQV